MRLRMIGVCLSLLAGSCLPALAKCDNASCVRIGSYNIKLFGNDGELATGAGRIDELATRIDETLDMDVVVLEEINVASESWKALRKNLEGRGYRIAIEGAFGGENPQRQQHVVIAHREAIVQQTATPVEVPIATTYDDGKGCSYASVRPPVVAFFKEGKFDFAVIGAHLKSMSPVDGSAESCDDDIRRDQAEKIIEWIGSQAGAERDFLIVGDLNSGFEEQEFDPFRSAGFATAMVDLPPWSGTASYLPGGGELIDHVLYAPDTSEFLSGSGLVFKLSKSEKKTYLGTQSDHVPIIADFTTSKDDD